ncbi:hypothetical protein [Paenibacillus sp. FSL R5-0914]|uniref:hypothetical protein n=1 Tax=Paenibacillus sp. FSL R5-0914 TaxID=2921665 RepID=UPI0030FB36CF
MEKTRKNIMNSEEIRAIIEEKIRSECKKYGSFDAAHMHYYNIFFDIYNSLGSEFNSIKKKYPRYKQIEFIHSKGKLSDYYEIVIGNANQVRERYYNNLTKEADKQNEAYFEQMRIESEEKDRLEYEEKVRNGTNTPLDDFIAAGGFD